MNHHKEISKICSPLTKFEITYFSHVCVDAEKKFSVICNNPDFIDLYFKKEYYNVDLHTADIEVFGSYVLWDHIPRFGKTSSMGADAAELGILHTFTMVEKNKEGCHFFHFSTHIDDMLMNQLYLSNVELLKMFNKYFVNEVLKTKNLSKAYQLKTQINQSANGYEANTNLLSKEKRSEFLTNFQLGSEFISNLTKREIDCLQLLVKGKAAREIGEILNLSKRTVEFYLANIKSKLFVSSKSDLIEKVIDYFK